MLATYFENETHDVLVKYDEYHLFLQVKVIYFETFTPGALYRIQIVIFAESANKNSSV